MRSPEGSAAPSMACRGAREEETLSVRYKPASFCCGPHASPCCKRSSTSRASRSFCSASSSVRSPSSNPAPCRRCRRWVPLAVAASAFSFSFSSSCCAAATQIFATSVQNSQLSALLLSLVLLVLLWTPLDGRITEGFHSRPVVEEEGEAFSRGPSPEMFDPCAADASVSASMSCCERELG